MALACSTSLGLAAVSNIVSLTVFEISDAEILLPGSRTFRPDVPWTIPPEYLSSQVAARRTFPLSVDSNSGVALSDSRRWQHVNHTVYRSELRLVSVTVLTALVYMCDG